MIHGLVLESRDLDNSDDDFDVSMFMVKNPDSDMEPYEDSIWVTVYFVAMHEDLTLGTYTVNNVPHSEEHSAFDKVNISLGIKRAVREAVEYLAELVATGQGSIA